MLPNQPQYRNARANKCLERDGRAVVNANNAPLHEHSNYNSDGLLDYADATLGDNEHFLHNFPHSSSPSEPTNTQYNGITCDQLRSKATDYRPVPSPVSTDTSSTFAGLAGLTLEQPSPYPECPLPTQDCWYQGFALKQQSALESQTEFGQMGALFDADGSGRGQCSVAHNDSTSSNVEYNDPLRQVPRIFSDLDYFLQDSAKEGVDPLTRMDYMKGIARSYGTTPEILRDLVAVLSRRHASPNRRSRSPEQTSSRSSSSFSTTEAREARKRRLIKEYLQKQHSAEECGKPRTSLGESGEYLCVWKGCNASFKRDDDWKRHCHGRQPNEVVVCDLCLDEGSRPDHRVLVTYRNDKISEHRRLQHGSDTGRGNSAATGVDPPRGFRLECRWCRVPAFSSVKDCLNHSAERHFAKPAASPKQRSSSGAQSAGRGVARRTRQDVEEDSRRAKRSKKQP